MINKVFYLWTLFQSPYKPPKKPQKELVTSLKTLNFISIFMFLNTSLKISHFAYIDCLAELKDVLRPFYVCLAFWNNMKWALTSKNFQKILKGSSTKINNIKLISIVCPFTWHLNHCKSNLIYDDNLQRMLSFTFMMIIYSACSHSHLWW